MCLGLDAVDLAGLARRGGGRMAAWGAYGLWGKKAGAGSV